MGRGGETEEEEEEEEEERVTGGQRTTASACDGHACGWCTCAGECGWCTDVGEVWLSVEELKFGDVNEQLSRGWIVLKVET